MTPIRLAALAILSIGLAVGCAGKPSSTEWKPTPSAEQRPKDPVLGDLIVNGTMFQNRLWLWNATGGLVAFDLDRRTREVIFEQGVISVRKSGGSLWILRSPNPLPPNRSPTELLLSAWRESGLVDISVPNAASGSAIVGFSTYRGRPLILFRNFIQTLSEDDATWKSLPLQGALGGSVVSPSVNDELYVGSNLGEWGGGLKRVHIPSGTVHTVERRDSDQICSGPLNSQCDPITSIIPDPKNPHCALASIGLVHLTMQRGRVLRVCGDNVEVFFEKIVTQRIDSERSYEESQAIFGLANAPSNAVWALGVRNLWRLTDGNAVGRPLPKLGPLLSLNLTRDLPGVIVIATGINRSLSLSGYTLLLIPLE